MKKFKITALQGVFLLLILAGIFAILTGSIFFYYIVTIIVITSILMYWMVVNNGKKMFQFLKLNTHEIIAGDTIKIEITTSNNSFFPVAHAKINCLIHNIHYDITLPSENMFFNPFQIINIKEEFQIVNRGIYNNSVVLTEITDPLRIFKQQITYERPLELIVYPKVYPLKYFYLPSTGYLGTKRVMKSGHEDYSNLKKVRLYTTGDSMKKIHWKLSSKRGEMFVKEFESTSSTKVSVMIDAYSENFLEDVNRKQEDCMIEIAASIIKYSLAQGAETSLYYQSDIEIQVESRDLSTFPNILKALVNFDAKGNLAFGELVNQESKRLEQGSYVVLLTNTINKNLISVILALRKRSFIVTLIIVNDENKFLEEKELLKAVDVHLYVIEPGHDIQEKLEAFK